MRDCSLIKENEVECQAGKDPYTLVDGNVDVYLVWKYFSSDAWLAVEDVMKCKSNMIMWVCQVCHQDLHSQPSIIYASHV